MAEATFYTVNGPRGEYYAVRNHDTGKVWTERTEHAAREQAKEEGLKLVSHQIIDHARLLDLMIPQAPPKKQPPERGLPGASPHASVHVASGLSRFLKLWTRSDHGRSNMGNKSEARMANDESHPKFD